MPEGSPVPPVNCERYEFPPFLWQVIRAESLVRGEQIGLKDLDAAAWLLVQELSAERSRQRAEQAAIEAEEIRGRNDR